MTESFQKMKQFLYFSLIFSASVLCSQTNAYSSKRGSSDSSNLSPYQIHEDFGSSSSLSSSFADKTQNYYQREGEKQINPSPRYEETEIKSTGKNQIPVHVYYDRENIQNHKIEENQQILPIPEEMRYGIRKERDSIASTGTGAIGRHFQQQQPQYGGGGGDYGNQWNPGYGGVGGGGIINTRCNECSPHLDYSYAQFCCYSGINYVCCNFVGQGSIFGHELNLEGGDGGGKFLSSLGHLHSFIYPLIWELFSSLPNLKTADLIKPFINKLGFGNKGKPGSCYRPQNNNAGYYFDRRNGFINDASAKSFNHHGSGQSFYPGYPNFGLGSGYHGGNNGYYCNFKDHECPGNLKCCSNLCQTPAFVG